MDGPQNNTHKIIIYNYLLPDNKSHKPTRTSSLRMNARQSARKQSWLVEKLWKIRISVAPAFWQTGRQKYICLQGRSSWLDYIFVQCKYDLKIQHSRWNTSKLSNYLKSPGEKILYGLGFSAYEKAQILELPLE